MQTKLKINYFFKAKEQLISPRWIVNLNFQVDKSE
jgi:hypothetical protein